MAFLSHLFIVTVMLSFNVIEFECTDNKFIDAMNFNRTLYKASKMMTDYPLGISDVFEEASGVFGKILTGIINKKKFLGIESFYNK